jgi:Na+-transporting NADH:ubiquinone oxidoreductase subunit NqrA
VLIDPEIENWFNGRATAFDISVTHLAAFTYYKAAAKKDNAAATEREIGKIKEYDEAMALNPIPANFIFKPLVVETFGSWSEQPPKS